MRLPARLICVLFGSLGCHLFNDGLWRGHQVDVGVASAVKTELCNRMNAHIKEHASEYEAPAKVILKGMSTNNLKVSMAVSYTMNFSRETRFAAPKHPTCSLITLTTPPLVPSTSCWDV